jgi:hypothetical protein
METLIVGSRFNSQISSNEKLELIMLPIFENTWTFGQWDATKNAWNHKYFFIFTIQFAKIWNNQRVWFSWLGLMIISISSLNF